MKCMSLFSGAGGLDLGVEAAGFDVAVSVERDQDCCDTLRLNGRRGVINSDVGSLDYAALGKKHDIELLIGGPPCQPFSKSALWSHRGVRGLLDSRADTIKNYVTAIKELRPRAFILENVEGFIRFGGFNFFQGALNCLSANGIKYSLSSAILNSAEYGVPQKRRRFFLVGILNGPDFVFPEATHGPNLVNYVTAWDACANLGHLDEDDSLRVKGRWGALLPSIPPGMNYLWHTRKGGGVPIFGWRTRYWSFLYKLDPNQPSPTIVASPSQNSGPFHWENRLLSTSELAALQTFSSSYQFSGNRASRQRQIGNAVPPLLAEHVARALKLQLGGSVKKKFHHAVKAENSAPSVPPVAIVPAEFLQYVGAHADHPGAGLGPRGRISLTQPTAT